MQAMLAAAFPQKTAYLLAFAQNGIHLFEPLCRQQRQYKDCPAQSTDLFLDCAENQLVLDSLVATNQKTNLQMNTSQYHIAARLVL